jgi:PhnB protein
MQLIPYLFFDGRCEEALKFYKEALGAEVLMLMRFKDGPESQQPGRLPPGSGDKVMHAHVRIGSAEFMASDGLCGGQPSFKGFSLSLTQADATKAGQAFKALSNGGRVDMPLGKTFWSPCFGMVADRFGMQWMITVPEQEQARGDKAASNE